jgi:Aromatic-ring hydroxylase, C-terminal
VLLNLGEPGGFDVTPWADRVQLIDATYGMWELPALGAVAAPTAVLIRPDGYVAWVGDRTDPGLSEALTTWFGPPMRRAGTSVIRGVPRQPRQGMSTAYAASRWASSRGRLNVM